MGRKGTAEGQAEEFKGFTRFAELFPKTRALGRRIVLHVGPTNSGKTWAAMERLAESSSGCYLAPLRLLALEGRDALSARGVAADLLTGEEHQRTPGAKHVSATVEMADFDRIVGVAVIDEAQLLQDADRGWAWASALFGIPASEVILCGSPDMIPCVEAVLEQTGETMEIVRFERKVPLDVLQDGPSLEALVPGDAVVAFSRAEVMSLRRDLLEHGRTVACIYGALGPEVRRAEAERFRSGAAEVLVATDAVGMGLNLPIRRLFFSAMTKYDGERDRPLTDSEIRQIAGRAGRFGQFEKGWVGRLGAEAPPGLAAVLAAPAEDPADARPLAFPSWPAVAAVSEVLGTEDLPRVMEFVRSKVILPDPACRPANMEDALVLARLTARLGIGLRDKYRYSCCPIDQRDDAMLLLFREWMSSHSQGAPVPPPLIEDAEVPQDDPSLQRIERAVKRLTSYLWCAQRWRRVYPFEEEARKERARLDGLIQAALRRRRLPAAAPRRPRPVQSISAHRQILPIAASKSILKKKGKRGAS